MCATQSNIDQCVPCDTPFYKNWVSKGAFFDKLVFADLKYVDGNITIKINKVPGISGKSCAIGWARDPLGGRQKINKCLGDYLSVHTTHGTVLNLLYTLLISGT